MSHPDHSKEFFSTTVKGLHALPPLKKRKSAFLAFVLGFLFGPIGLAIYLQSWLDLGLGLLTILILIIVIPGIGLLPAWIFAGFYGALRVIYSNRHFNDSPLVPDAHEKHQDEAVAHLVNVVVHKTDTWEKS